MTLNDYIREPKKDWNDKQWLEYAYVQVHSPWINDEDKEYFNIECIYIINIVNINFRGVAKQ